MTDPSNPDQSRAASLPALHKVAGIDTYTWLARIAPAVLTSLPLLSLAALALPLLRDADKIWSLSAVAVTTFAALIARRAGNKVQPTLIAAWGGWPTTDRLRYSSSASSSEVLRRHDQLRRVLGRDLVLPTALEEQRDPAAADRVYGDAMQRVIGLVRGNLQFPLVAIENRNFGYARNLLGLKRLGQVSALAALAVAIGAIIWGRLVDSTANFSGLVLPALVGVAALAMWRLVDADFVRPSAEAYANRIIEALDTMPSATRPDAADSRRERD